MSDEPHESDDLRYLREKAKLSDEAARRVGEMERRIAFHESGVDMDHPHGKLFLKALEKSESWRLHNPTAEEIRETARLYQVPIRGEELE